MGDSLTMKTQNIPKTWTNSAGMECIRVRCIRDEGQTIVVYKHYRKAQGEWAYYSDKAEVILFQVGEVG